MSWHKWPDEVPPRFGTYLCIGESYDSSYQNGYILAEYSPLMEGESRFEDRDDEVEYNERAWTRGKQCGPIGRIDYWMEPEAKP